jgi:hypothetical protein
MSRNLYCVDTFVLLEGVDAKASLQFRVNSTMLLFIYL